MRVQWFGFEDRITLRHGPSSEGATGVRWRHVCDDLSPLSASTGGPNPLYRWGVRSTLETLVNL